jgi:PAS domain S-box-containing protein
MKATSTSQPAQPRLDHQDWQRIADAISDGLIITDRNFNILFVNRAFATLSGVDAIRLIGKKCHDVFSNDLCSTPDCPLTQLQSIGEQRVFNHQPHCKNGQTCTMDRNDHCLSRCQRDHWGICRALYGRQCFPAHQAGLESQP